MKRLLLIILLSVGLTNVSYSQINPLAMSNNDLCGVLKSYYSGASTYYGGVIYSRQEVVMISIEKNKRGLKCFGDEGGDISNTIIPKYAVPLNDERSTVNWKCAMNYKVVDNSYCIPDMAKISTNALGWECYSGYKKTGSIGKENCKKIKKLKIPANAFESGNTWFCKSGFAKVGNRCIKTSSSSENTLIIPTIPANAHKAFVSDNIFKKTSLKALGFADDHGSCGIPTARYIFGEKDFTLIWSCSLKKTNSAEGFDTYKGNYTVNWLDYGSEVGVNYGFFPVIRLSYYVDNKRYIDYISFMNYNKESEILIYWDQPSQFKRRSSDYSKYIVEYIKDADELNNREILVLKPSKNLNSWECNSGFKKSDDKCINKINKLVVPSYRN